MDSFEHELCLHVCSIRSSSVFQPKESRVNLDCPVSLLKFIVNLAALFCSFCRRSLRPFPITSQTSQQWSKSRWSKALYARIKVFRSTNKYRRLLCINWTTKLKYFNLKRTLMYMVNPRLLALGLYKLVGVFWWAYTRGGGFYTGGGLIRGRHFGLTETDVKVQGPVVRSPFSLNGK